MREIEETLLNEYDLEAERCQRDVDGLLRDLTAHGLIQIEE